MSSANTTTTHPQVGGPLTALIVGGTSGIGAAIAVEIARLHPSARITVAGRDATRGAQVVEECRRAAAAAAGDGNGNNNNKIDFRPIDACKMADVERFAREYARDVLPTAAAGGGDKEQQVDVLVLSQGILTTQGRTPARNGSSLDQKMALHLYSRIALIDSMSSSSSILAPNALVMSVLDGKNSSVNSRSIQWDDLGLQRPGAYGLSSAAATCLGLTDAMFQHYASLHSGRRTFVHAYPGIVATPISNNGAMPAPMRWGLKALMSVMAVDASTCAERLVKGAWECRKGGGGGAWNIDEKGQVVANKAKASEDQKRMAREHTKSAIAEDVAVP